MINAGLLLASRRVLIFGGPVISRVNWKVFARCQVRAAETLSGAKHQFSDRKCDVRMNAQSPHKWWSTLNLLCSARVRTCLSLLVGVVDWCASRFDKLI